MNPADVSALKDALSATRDELAGARELGLTEAIPEIEARITALEDEVARRETTPTPEVNLQDLMQSEQPERLP